MKIGITCYPTYGGSGVVATELGIELAKRGNEVHFICYARPYRLPEFLQNVFYHEVQVNRYPLFDYPPYSLALASKMVDVAKHHDLDILHVHYAIPHATSAILAKEMLRNKIKVMTTLHGTDITVVGANHDFFEITKFAMEKSDIVTSVSHFLKNETYKTFNFGKKIEVVHNFIEPPTTKKSRLKENFALKDEKTITHISNFRKVKRISDVILVVEQLLKKERVKLLMVGDGPERSVAEKMCRDRSICAHITFLGKQQDVGSILHHTDIFLFPSKTESFGLAALEAMSYGIPVIGTASGGIEEVVDDGINGFLSEVGDIGKMTKDIITLLNDTSLYDAFSKSAQKKSVDAFHPQKIIPKYISLYKKLVKDA